MRVSQRGNKVGVCVEVVVKKSKEGKQNYGEYVNHPRRCQCFFPSQSVGVFCLVLW